MSVIVYCFFVIFFLIKSYVQPSDNILVFELCYSPSNFAEFKIINATVYVLCVA